MTLVHNIDMHTCAQGSSYIELHYMEYTLNLLQYKYCVQIDHLSCLSFLGNWIGVLIWHMIIYILAHWGQSWRTIKGCMVYQYYFDMKPFNLAACFIMKCYDYVHHNGRPLTAVYNNVQALVMFLGIQRQYWLVRTVLYVVEEQSEID